MISRASSHLRIIGGQWRGRKLAIPDIEGLRPTPDRVRETLFNWLANDCAGASVLDCFAGSGALGFESLSRGATRLTMIEQNRLACDNLQLQLTRLEADQAQLICGDVIEVIPGLESKYHLVFIDPPYASAAMRHQVMASLETHQLLHPGARIYFEWPQGETLDLAFDHLKWLKQKKAGQVNYAIAEWQGSR